MPRQGQESYLQWKPLRDKSSDLELSGISVQLKLLVSVLKQMHACLTVWLREHTIYKMWKDNDQCLTKQGTNKQLSGEVHP